MTVNKIVMWTFVFVCKTGKATCFPQGWKVFITAGKKLVGIALVAYVPDNCVLRTVKYTMKSNCELNNSKITCKMSAVFSNYIDNSVTDFLSELLELLLRKFFYIIRRMNLRK